MKSLMVTLFVIGQSWSCQEHADDKQCDHQTFHFAVLLYVVGIGLMLIPGGEEGNGIRAAVEGVPLDHRGLNAIRMTKDRKPSFIPLK